MSNYNSILQSNNADLQAILNTINELPDKDLEEGSNNIKIASGTFTSNGSQNTLSISGLPFNPSNIIIEARTKVTIFAANYNVVVLAIGSHFDSYVAYNSSKASQPRMGKASGYATAIFDNNGFDLTLQSGVFGQATYYWTAIGG